MPLNLRISTCKSIVEEYLTFSIFRQIFQSLLLNLLIFPDKHSIREALIKTAKKLPWGGLTTAKIIPWIRH